MIFGHLMIDPYVILIFYTLCENHVILICRLGFRWHELYSVTADHRLSHTVYHIPTDWADIEYRSQHISRYIGILDLITG